MAGVWRHELAGNRVAVTIAPFAEAPPWVKQAAEDEAGRLAAFLGSPLDLRWEA
jgi:hypothetical protein